MQHSIDSILATHVGNLIRSLNVLEAMMPMTLGDGEISKPSFHNYAVVEDPTIPSKELWS